MINLVAVAMDIRIVVIVEMVAGRVDSVVE